MKVLMIINGSPFDPYGGLGVHVYSILQHLKDVDDLDIVLLSANYDDQDGGLYFVSSDGKRRRVSQEDWVYKKGQYRLIEIHNTNTFMTDAGLFQRFITDFLFIESALYHLGDERFDLIHLHDTNLWNVAKSLRCLNKCPVVLSSHLNLFFSHAKYPGSVPYMYNIQSETDAIINSKGLIAVSEDYKKNLQKDYRIPDERIDVIHNGVDYESFAKLDKGAVKKKHVVFVGRLVPTKGLWEVFGAIKKMPDYYFTLISCISPTLEPTSALALEIKKMQKKYKNFEWHVKMPQEEKFKIMATADVGIMPSLHEPFGITALEWMSMGIPLIVSNRGGLAEFCNDKNSTVIEPTIENLVDAINNHKWDNNKLENATMTAQSFDWGTTARKTLEVYRKVIV